MPQGKPRKAQVAQRRTAPSATKPYTLFLTASAEAVYKEYARRAREAEERGDPTNAHCTAFNMLKETIKEHIPLNPIDKKYALEGQLSNTFRIKKGRMRICWIASSSLRVICVLFISESLRKAGDVNDPYETFARMVMSGQFNDFFQQLGVKLPTMNRRPHVSLLPQ
jgi:mRNA-degrading endonuclease RelE of RelBE toxin-antitoxin system